MNQLFARTQCIIDTCFDLFNDEIVVCFNGGKDATVLLDLVYESFTRRFPGSKLPCLYVEEPSGFSEISQFVQSSASR